jgi:hypothetical protein
MRVFVQLGQDSLPAEVLICNPTTSNRPPYAAVFAIGTMARRLQRATTLRKLRTGMPVRTQLRSIDAIDLHSETEGLLYALKSMLKFQYMAK